MGQVAGWNLFVSLGVLLSGRFGKHRGYLSEIPDSCVVHTSSFPLFFFFIEGEGKKKGNEGRKKIILMSMGWFF